MTKKVYIFIFLGVLGAVSYYVSNSSQSKTNLSHEHSHAEKAVYTCPMHPQIRQDHPGKCPICHMDLVKVLTDQKTNSMEGSTSKINLNVSPYQVRLAGIQPTKAKEENVTLNIPVAGRMQSASTIVFQIFEADLRYVKRGVSFEGWTEVFPENKIFGRITSVDTIADPNSRTVRAIGLIEKNKTPIPVEGSFNGQIKVDLGKKIVVPEKSVLFTGQGSYVYLYDNDVLKPRKVTIGPKIDEKYIIIKGLDLGDSISSGPNFLIDSESKIRGLNDQSHH